MNALRVAAHVGSAWLLAACAGPADHFYTLSTQPDASGAPATKPFDAHVILSTAIPPLIDRTQMLVNTSDDQIVILEHERWAAPLSELVAHTLARDIEQRRPGVLVGGAGFDQAALATIKIRVDVVRMSARKDGRAVLEAHWRILGPGADSDHLDGGVFTAPVAGGEYAAIALAFSTCLGSLADKIAERLPEH